MAQYTVKVGQNIFDVTLSIYGSIEGLLDLFACNPKLSIDSEIKDGDIFNYTDNYFEDSTVLDYYKTNRIIPANQAGTVYYNKLSDLKMIIYIDGRLKNFSLSLSGNGKINIDWGDSSHIESYDLSSKKIVASHITESESVNNRKICLYGDFKIYDIDFTSIPPQKLYIFTPIYIESCTFLGAIYLKNIDFLNLINPESLINIDLVHTKLSDLRPLIRLKQAKSINLSYSNIKQSVLDQYLKLLVKEYGIRRNCTVNLIGSIEPSGIYQQPEDLRNPTTGMEAIWVIVNEHKESTGPWKFILNNNTYTI